MIDEIADLCARQPGRSWTEQYQSGWIIWTIEVEASGRVCLVNECRVTVRQARSDRTREQPPGVFRLPLEEWYRYWKERDPAWIGVIAGRLRKTSRSAASSGGLAAVPDSEVPEWLRKRRAHRRAAFPGTPPIPAAPPSSPEKDA